MFIFTLFTVSGVVIVTITLAKRREEKKRESNFILRAVSRGDERVRELHHRSLSLYSTGKEKFYFWATKQMPLRAKSNLNKLQTYLRDGTEKYLGDMRNSRLLKRSEGISEFFKNISDIEKGAGQINDDYPEGSISAESVTVVETVVQSVPASVIEISKAQAPIVDSSVTVIKRTRSRKPKAVLTNIPEIRISSPVKSTPSRKRRIKVVEIL